MLTSASTSRRRCSSLSVYVRALRHRPEVPGEVTTTAWLPAISSLNLTFCLIHAATGPHFPSHPNIFAVISRVSWSLCFPSYPTTALTRTTSTRHSLQGTIFQLSPLFAPDLVASITSTNCSTFLKSSASNPHSHRDRIEVIFTFYSSQGTKKSNHV